MTPQTLHLIGNAHIDPVWLWPWSDGLAEVMATFRSALDRMDEFPEFTFTASSAAFYAWVEQVDPPMFAEILRRVKQGRWQIVGGWWIEPDCNIPGGESFARQALYGQRYFQSRFGRTARTGFCVDSFGHNGMLPQILKKSGLDFYVFMRPMPHEKELPGRVFWWQAPDGSRVLTCRLPIQYGTWTAQIADHVRSCASEIQPPLDALPCFYGVGDHGGGPTIANLNELQRLRQEPGLPELVFSSLDAFFDSTVGKRLPVVSDDLQHHASGCYAAHSGIKRWVRETENALLSAEKFSAAAFWQAALPYPDDFERAWKALLFNQFHDILAGTSLESAYETAQSQLGEARSIAGRARTFAMQAIARQIELPVEAGAQPFVVFNPNAWAVRLPVEIEPGPLDGSETLLDPQGAVIETQATQSEGVAAGRGRLCFMAELPGLGYQVYRLKRSAEILEPISAGSPRAGVSAESKPAVKAVGTALENQHLRLEIDPQTGLIASLFDKERQVEVFSAPAARAVVIDDPSDTWSHGVFQFHQEIGQFSARRVETLASGPLRAAVRVESSYGASTLVQEFALYDGLDQVEVRVTVDWREQQKMLKLAFPCRLESPLAGYEIPYGSIQRPADGEEEPGQAWVDISGIHAQSRQPYGLALLNDGKYSFDVLGSTLSLTVLRSPAYTHHLPYQLDAATRYTFMDQGVQRFSYVLCPHAAGAQTAGAQTAGLSRRAAELNQPPEAFPTSFHAGPLAQRVSFLTAEPENILVTALKKAEDGDDLILRACETAGISTLAAFHLGEEVAAFQVRFAPCEIKTLRIPRDPSLPAVETDMLEFQQ